MNKHFTNQIRPSSVQRQIHDRADRAFTLTELLVVLATLGILSVLLLPAQNITQSGSSKSFQCLNNLRQRAVAWTLYSEENHDRLANNYDTASIQADLALPKPTYASWVEDIMDWSPQSYVTNLVGIRATPFNSCLSGNVAVYKCPADHFLSGVQKAVGWPARPRSYSMNCFLGATKPNWYNGAGNEFYPAYKQFLKMGQIPAPENLYVFLDEHADSINDGDFSNDADPDGTKWINSAGSQTWADIPASYHGGACVFSFADGHSEVHEWKSTLCTILPVTFGPLPHRTFDAAGLADGNWIATRSSVPK
jgi:prepilin-type N-terminal cleavage/methylation domain-containing protein/prepilin-type processing-associated H-X9-DG protein